MYAIRYSKEKADQRNDKERTIQQEYEEATRRLEKDPNDYNRSRLRTFALIVFAHPYCESKFTCHVMHQARAKY